MDACALQRTREIEVGFLVEARLEFDHRGDRFARFRRRDERLDDGRFVGRAVKRLLYRQHVRVGRRLFEELHHHVETLIGVVNDDVLVADCRETIVVVLADALGKARPISGENQVLTSAVDQLAELRHADRAGQLHDVLGLGVELFNHQFAQRFRHVGAQVQAHDAAESPPAQHGFEQQDEVLGLFFVFDVAVADKPEHAAADDPVAGEELIDEQAHQVLQRDEADILTRNADEAVHLIGQGNKRPHLSHALDGFELQRKGKPAIGDEGKRMRRVDGQGRQHGKDLFQKVIAEPVYIVRA